MSAIAAWRAGVAMPEVAPPTSSTWPVRSMSPRFTNANCGSVAGCSRIQVRNASIVKVSGMWPLAGM